MGYSSDRKKQLNVTSNTSYTKNRIVELQRETAQKAVLSAQQAKTDASYNKLTTVKPFSTDTAAVKVNMPTKFDYTKDTNPIQGESLFQANVLPIRKNDNIAAKIGKGVVNFGASVISAPVEALRKTAIQGGSLLTGHGIQKNLPKNTTFVDNILPKGAGTAVNKFAESHPVFGGIAKMGIEALADPTTYLGGGLISNASKASKTMGKVAESNIKTLSKLNKGKAVVQEAAEVAQDTVKPQSNITTPTVVNNVTVAPQKVGLNLQAFAADKATHTGKYNGVPIKIMKDEGDDIVRYTVIDAGGNEVKVALPRDKFNAKASDIKPIEVAETVKKVGQQFAENGDPISQFKTNTVARDVDTPDYVKEMIPDTDFSYNRESSKAWQLQAGRNIGINKQQVMDDITNATSISGGVQAHEAAILSHELLIDAEKTGDFSKYKSFLKTVASKTRETARALKGTDTAWEKKTADGAIMDIQRTVDGVEESIKKANPNKIKQIEKETKEVTDAVNKAHDDAVNELANELNKNTVADATPNLADGKLKPKVKTELTPEQLLANKIKTTVNPKVPAEATMIDKMVSELFTVAKESPIGEPTVNISNPLSNAADALNSRQLYVDTWNKAKAIVRETFKDNPDALTVLDNYFEKGIKPPYSMSKFNAAFEQGAKKLDINMGDIVKQYYAKGTENKQTLIDHLINKSGLKGDEANALASSIEKRFRELKKQKAEGYLKSLFKVKEKGVSNPLGDVEALSNTGAFANNNYKAKVLEKLSPKLNALIKDSGINMDELVRQGYGKTAFERDRFVKKLSEKLKVNDTDLRTILDTALTDFNKLAADKRTQILNNMLKPKEVKTAKTLYEKVISIINLGGYDDAAIRDLIKQKEGLPILENSDIQKISEYMNKAKEFAEGSYNQRDMYGRVGKIIANKTPASLTTKIVHAPRMAMLGAMKTFFTKNFGGNVGNDFYEEFIRSVPSSIIDMAVSKIAKTERSILLPSLKGAATKIKGYGTGFAEQTKDILRGTDTAPNLVAGEISQGRIYNNKILNGIDQFIRNGLQYGDRPTFQATFDEAIRQQKKILKTDVITVDMKKFAHEVASDRVFQNKSETAKGLGGLRTGINQIGKGLLGIGSKEGGAGNVVSPFINTAANIGEKVVENTPLGASKLFSLVKDFNNSVGIEKTIAQRKLVDTIGRMITGTTAVGVGIEGVKKGVLTGRSNKDADMANFDKETGKQPYSVKIGNKYTPFTSLPPLSTALAIGADIGSNMKEGSSKITSALDGVKTGTNTFMQQSFLKGFSDLFGYGDFANGASRVATGYPSQWIPQTLNASSKYGDKFDRQTYDPNSLKYSGNVMKSRVPGARQQLPIKQNIFGEDTKTFNGHTGVQRFLDAFISPVNSSTYNPTPVQKEIARLYDEGGTKIQVPTIVEKTIAATKDHPKIELTAVEYNQYQKRSGQLTMNGSLTSIPPIKGFAAIINSEQYKKAKANKENTVDEVKAKILATIIEKAKKQAKKEILKARGYGK